jgi:hypothetical protein
MVVQSIASSRRDLQPKISTGTTPRSISTWEFSLDLLIIAVIPPFDQSPIDATDRDRLLFIPVFPEPSLQLIAQIPVPYAANFIPAASSLMEVSA